MTTEARKTTSPSFRTQSQALALEPHILFDGAAAVAVEQQHAGGTDQPMSPVLRLPIPMCLARHPRLRRRRADTNDAAVVPRVDPAGRYAREPWETSGHVQIDGRRPSLIGEMAVHAAGILLRESGF